MSHKCAWCHISPGVINIHPSLQDKHTLFCQECHNDYSEFKPSQKTPAGIIPSCFLKETKQQYFLFGLEKAGWCHLQGNADPSDKSVKMTACREGAEEACYSIGTPQYIMKEFFDKGKYSQPGNWGAFILNFGEMSQKEMNNIIQKHKENIIKIKSLNREPTNCEKEMLELRWCLVNDFKQSVTNCNDKQNLVVGGFDSRKFRPWCLPYYKVLVDNLLLHTFL